MKKLLLIALLGSLVTPVQATDEWKSLFDGKTLKGWEGKKEFWSVQDGAITGQTTKEKPTKGNTFIIWRGGETADFELRMKFKIVGGNSGKSTKCSTTWTDATRAISQGGNATWSSAGRLETPQKRLGTPTQKTMPTKNSKPTKNNNLFSPDLSL